MTEALFLMAGIAIAAAAVFAWQWWLRGRALRTIAARCAHLDKSLAAANRSLARMAGENKEKQIALATLNENLTHTRTQLDQLRDLVKVHVARRREYDEWANPIRSSLGEAVGKVMQELKEKVARQEFSMQRQERVVAEAKDQYRGKRDELEGLRR